MADVILVLNAGSSSIKFSAFDVQGDTLGLIVHGQVEGLYTAAAHFSAVDHHGEHHDQQWAGGDTFGHHEGLERIAAFLAAHQEGHRLAAVGHRVVHGGQRFSGPVRVTPAIVAELEKLTPLAPLHQPHNLTPIRILEAMQPGIEQVACFDTAFHCTQPAVSQAFALPESITSRGVRRYGFHGLSYEYIASVLPDVAPRAARGRTVVAHLGNGASMCALVAGKSVASTMGFTAVDGLPMGTRCGNLDPGVVLFLMEELGMDVRAVEDLIYRRSGLLGVSGLSSDMRTLLASDDPHARFAIELYIYRIARELGSLAAAMEGIDAIVFTAGIGEHAAVIREGVMRRAAWLGVEIDVEANNSGGPLVTTASSRVPAWVIPTNEEWMIAQHTRRLIR
ncbi:acetate/propionate family kinase [Burkholderia contaminans]|uniref:acetate/propionate family kinase n=1 Tax=Burkholderia contaminans TaxID=488447 RepID=UPI001CF5C1A4|nr:acetate/propionate family kinase [Burkholderia contaminans]MCA7916412.1 acetate/propionate family kinase [Burkholderia contaminans]MCA8095728.1 acetate/propionate family kinase [Burkholderia contaminans]UUX40211.1 acetate/propionate family kinase [Burkholderia contaminans]